MFDQFYGFDFALQVFWGTAAIASVIFVIQAIMTFMGGDAGDGLSADFESLEGADGPFQLLSLRSLINFAMGFGWTGVSFYYHIPNMWWLIVLSTLVGVAFVAVFVFVMAKLSQLAEDNTFKTEETLGQIADVYLRIPGHMQGKGKVMLSIKGSYKEIDAMTEFETQASGSAVRIVKVENPGLVIIEPLNKP